MYDHIIFILAYSAILALTPLLSAVIITNIWLSILINITKLIQSSLK